MPKKEPGVFDIAAVSDDAPSIRSARGRSTHVPMRMKIIAVLMVSLIGFGSKWSSGVTGAMKSTLKKVSISETIGVETYCSCMVRNYISTILNTPCCTYLFNLKAPEETSEAVLTASATASGKHLRISWSQC